MIKVTEGDISMAVVLSNQLPEFVNPAGEEEYKKRLGGVPHLILIAWQGDIPVGFKVGYQKDDYFYSWMGGVLPGYRDKGVARFLAEAQEQWAKKAGFKSIVFKTRNQHKGMLLFAIKNGFNIIGFTEKKSVLANRIQLKKVL